MAAKAVVPKNDRTLARRAAIREAFVALVNTVPVAEDGDIADLLGPIIGAATWEELADQDLMESSKTLVGKRIVVESVARAVSDHESLTGFYLQCEGVYPETGESIRFTAGGEHVVATLSKLYVLGALPAEVLFVQTETRSGNDAINCKVVDKMPSRTVEG